MLYNVRAVLKRAHIDDEGKLRIAKVCVAFGELGPSVWERKCIKLSTKLKVAAVVLRTLLYHSKCGSVYGDMRIKKIGISN